MNQNQEFGVLDLLNILSLWLQIENQKNIIGIKDIQHEVDRAIDLLNDHLQKQDAKINKIMEVLNVEEDKGTV